METILSELEQGLKGQLTALTDDIRAAEEKLMRNKEGYLKVQGALEIITVIRQRQVELDNKEMKEAITGVGQD